MPSTDVNVIVVMPAVVTTLKPKVFKVDASVVGQVWVRLRLVPSITNVEFARETPVSGESIRVWNVLPDRTTVCATRNGLQEP